MNKLLKRILFLFLILFAFCIQAQFTTNSVIPTKGKQFWLGYMQNYIVKSTDTLKIFVASDVNTIGTVSIPNIGYSQAFSVTANQMTTVIIPNNLGEHFTSEVIEQKGVFIETNDICSVFAINFDSYTSDATKVLPLQALGSEYMVMSYTGFAESEFLMVANYDSTELEIIPTSLTKGGHAAGVPFTVMLNRGESYQVQASVATGDLTGSTVKTTAASGNCKTFALFSGNSCAVIPNGCSFCDHIFDQSFPVNVWGTRYNSIPFLGTTGHTIRILAAYDSTFITINGAAPFMLNAGQYFEQNSLANGTCISADKNINVTQFMQGSTCSGGLGDPAMIQLNTERDKIDNVTFATVKSTVITQHTVNVVMETQYINLLTLDGVPVPSSSFSLYPSCSNFSFAQIPITEGSHTLDGNGQGFIAYVYGMGQNETYAYSVGSGYKSEEAVAADSFYCSTDTVLLSSPSLLFSPYWSTLADPADTLSTDNTFSVLPGAPEVYVLTGATGTSGCPEKFYFSVESPVQPALNIVTNRDTVCQFQPIELYVDANPDAPYYFYSWSPANGLDDPSIRNPIATPFATTTYTCTVSTASGCMTSSVNKTLYVTDGSLLDISILAGQDKFCLGEATNLDLYIERKIFQDGFDGGITASNWVSTTSGTANTVCGSVNGDALYFNGGGLRYAETQDLDVSAGGSVRFAIKIADGSAPCDDVDFGEDIVLEYSTNGGSLWTTISTFYEFLYPTFKDVKITIPVGAETNSTRFRWRQITHSGAGQDNWMLDNVIISVIRNYGYNYTWSPGGSLSSTIIPNPLATPTVSTNYHIQIEDTSTSCFYNDSILIDVGQPFTLQSSPDTFLCDINGTTIVTTPSIPGEYSFLWSPSSSLQNPIDSITQATPTSPTQYIVDVTSEQGCSARDTVEIDVRMVSSFDASPNASNICKGDTITFNSEFIAPCGALGSPCASTTSNQLGNLSLTTSSDFITPFSGQSRSSKKQYLITQSELNAIGIVGPSTITSLGFNVSAVVGTSLYENFTIRMKCSSLNTFVNTFESGAEEVFISQDINITTGWNDFDFDYNYSWDGTSNLIVEICYSNISSSTSSWVYYSFQAGKSMYTNSFWDVCGNVTGNAYSFRPDMRFSNCSNDNSGFTYSWSPANGLDDPTTPNPLLTVADSNVYQISAFDSVTGCLFKDSITINAIDTTYFLDAGEDTVVCNSSGVMLNPTHDFGSGYNVVWTPDGSFNNPNIINPTLTIANGGSFIVAMSDAAGCTRKVDTIEVVISIPSLILDNDTAVCLGDSADILVSGASTYLWSPTQTVSDSTSANPSVFPSDTTVYTVIGFDSIGCQNSDVITINVDFPPDVNLKNDTSVCNGDTVMIQYSETEYTFLWNDADTNNIKAISDSGIYTVDISNKCGVVVDSIELVVHLLPQPDAGNDTEFCSGDTSSIGAGVVSSFIYMWSPPTGLTSTIVSQPGITLTYSGNFADTNTYVLTVTDSNSCVNQDTVEVVVDPLPENLAINGDSAFCPFDSAAIFWLNDSLVSGYSWSVVGGAIISGQGTDSIIIDWDDTNPNASVSVVPTNIWGCEGAIVSKDILIHPWPIVDAGSDTSYCSGQSIPIGSTPISNYQYLWNPSMGISDSLVANPNSTWSTSDTIPDTLTHIVRAVNSNTGCINYDTINLIINPLPRPDAGEDKEFCSGDTTNIGTANIATYSYVWSPATGLTSTIVAQPYLSLTNSLYVPDTSSYILTVTDNNLCENTDTVKITIDPLPQNLKIQGDTAICPFTLGKTYWLEDSLINGYAWVVNGGTIISGQGTDSITVNWDDTNPNANIKLMPVNVWGCLGDTVKQDVIIHALPTTNAGADANFCSEDTIQIGSSSITDYGYLWSPGNGLSDSLIAYPLVYLINGDTISDTITYYLTVTDSITSCIDFDTISIIVNPLPRPDAGNDQIICSGDSAILGSTPIGNYSYLWTPGTGLDSIDVAQPVLLLTSGLPDTAVYILGVTDQNTCYKEDTVRVIINPLPDTADVFGSISVCPDVTGIDYWSVDSVATIFGWSVVGGAIVSGQGTDSIVIDWGPTLDSAWVKLQLTNNFGCSSDTEYFHVTINPILQTQTPIGPDTLCWNDADNIDYLIPNTNGSTYLWQVDNGSINTGDSSNLVNISWDSVGLGYVFINEHVTTSTSVCFGQSDTLFVEILPSPDTSLSIFGDLSVCAFTNGAGYGLNGLDSSSYVWGVTGGVISNGQGSDAILVDWGVAGTYDVFVLETSNYGCFVDTVWSTVTVNSLPNPQLLSGIQNICPQILEGFVYEVNGFTNSTFIWTVTGGEIISGDSSSTITVNWDSVITDKLITVMETSEFGCLDTALTIPIYWDPSSIELNLVSDDISDPELINLSWTINTPDTLANDLSLYRRELHPDSSTWTLVDVISKNSNTYVDGPLQTSEYSYQYYLRTNNSCNYPLITSGHNSILLTVTTDASEMINLSWNHYKDWGKDGISGYEIYRSLDNQGLQIYTTIDADSSFQFDNSIEAFDHCYRVKAIQNAPEELVSWSNVSCLSFEHNILIYNALTPNGDDKNDFFWIDNIEKYPDNTVEIYNRWGNMVYTKDGYINDWDGGNLPDGTYYYVVTISTVNSGTPFQGTLLLQR